MKQNCCNKDEGKTLKRVNEAYIHIHIPAHICGAKASHSFLLNNSGHERKKKIIIIKAKKGDQEAKKLRKSQYRKAKINKLENRQAKNKAERINKPKR